MLKYALFDAADYLDNEETIAEYITAALEDPNPVVLLAAVRDVARARGMAQLAKDAHKKQGTDHEYSFPQPDNAPVKPVIIMLTISGNR